MSVIPFKQEKHTIHGTGAALCLFCQHEWVAVVETADELPVWLNCPACHCEKGIFKYPWYRGDHHWKCACENALFQVNKHGVWCPNCGKEQAFP